MFVCLFLLKASLEYIYRTTGTASRMVSHQKRWYILRLFWLTKGTQQRSHWLKGSAGCCHACCLLATALRFLSGIVLISSLTLGNSRSWVLPELPCREPLAMPNTLLLHWSASYKARKGAWQADCSVKAVISVFSDHKDVNLQISRERKKTENLQHAEIKPQL